MLIVQPKHNFGDLLSKELLPPGNKRSQWNTFEFAVAWLNYAGARKLTEPMRGFLAGGGRISATVGLDFGSTTYEALSILLDLAEGGSCITTSVFFDENSACTFHPKIFLFSNAEQSSLFVGSNNMTGAGLGTNLEAALKFSGPVTDATILETRKTLSEWHNEKLDTRIRLLNRKFLEQLRECGYVPTEEDLRSRRAAEVKLRSSKGAPLFGRSTTTPNGKHIKVVEKIDLHRAKSSTLGDALLMRVRPRRNGKQLQISMLLHASFMRGTEVVVAENGTRKDVGYNIAKGVRNTARFEAPEMSGMKNPVARFWWEYPKGSKDLASQVLRYQIFDADDDPEGIDIFQKLEAGIQASASTNLEKLSHTETVISKPNRDIAQWYRLDFH